ncbi:MAG: cytochrome c [Acidobacteria bacterium]|nr:cytochrome c [Acidobacteriota bacterium]
MRSRELRLIGTAVILACVPWVVHAQTFGFGRPPTPEEIKGVFPSAAPDGTGLPPGRGTAKDGAAVYAQKCAACHGPNGTGTALHRGLIPLGNAKPVKLEESLVPYATTVWDFINRAMPWTTPGTLTPDEAYAVTAYVLYLNKIVGEADVLDATTLPKVRMPHRDNFIPAQPGWTPGERRRLGNYPARQ